MDNATGDGNGKAKTFATEKRVAINRITVINLNRLRHKTSIVLCLSLPVPAISLYIED